MAQAPRTLDQLAVVVDGLMMQRAPYAHRPSPSRKSHLRPRFFWAAARPARSDLACQTSKGEKGQNRQKILGIGGWPPVSAALIGQPAVGQGPCSGLPSPWIARDMGQSAAIRGGTGLSFGARIPCQRQRQPPRPLSTPNANADASATSREQQHATLESS